MAVGEFIGKFVVAIIIWAIATALLTMVIGPLSPLAGIGVAALVMQGLKAWGI